MYEKIYLSVDHSDDSKRATALATEIGRAFSASLVVGHVDPSFELRNRCGRLQASLAGRSADAPQQAKSAAGETAPTGEGRPSAETARDRAASLLGETTSAAIRAGLSAESRLLEGRAFSSLASDIDTSGSDLVVVAARGEGRAHQVGSVCERLLRTVTRDTLVVKEDPAREDGHILVCIDGSRQSYAGLMTALALSKKLGRQVEAVGVYDPYLHYTLFNGIVTVLSEQASKVFKFQDQEKLHEEIIDTGLAKIYQAHLEVARRLAHEQEVDIRITLLDGKAFQKLLQHARRTKPWLMVLGRIGVHSDEQMDIGATSENLLRLAPCNMLIASRTYHPPIDVEAEESVEWTPEAKRKMERVPSFVRGVATTAILRWSVERGHSVITPSVINSAMGDLLPPGAAQAMGYVAEEVAIEKDRLRQGITYICPNCGHAVRDVRPEKCVVCSCAGSEFEEIDRGAIESAGTLDRGDLVTDEETFDGVRLKWTLDAKHVLRRVPSGYDRRRTKARIEKTARVRGLSTVTAEFALDMVEQEIADGSYLSERGERLDVELPADGGPDDAVPRPREGSPLPWTDAAWKRICRVPDGFMRDMTREKVEEFAADRQQTFVDLALCEDGIAEGRRMMAEALANQSRKSQKPTP